MDEPFCIEVTNLTKRFGDLIAVNGLTLRIRPGEIYGFLGLNGAGKTTTIRMLLGMIRPSAGTVSLFGIRIRPGEQSIWRRVGYLVETPHAYPDLTVRENLEITRRWRGLNNSLMVDKIIGDMKLTPYAGRRAGKLSLGNAQRLGLAKALIHHPDLLILDEPANALDPAGIVEIRELLHNLAERDGVTVFISSHILSEIARLATRIGVVHKGWLIQELDATSLAQQEDQHLTVDVHDTTAGLEILAKAGIAASVDGRNTLIISDQQTIRYPENIATLLVEAGSPPMRLVVERVDLESYFIKLVGLEKGSSDEQRR